MRERDFWERLWRRGQAPRRKRKWVRGAGLVFLLLCMAALAAVLPAWTAWAKEGENGGNADLIDGVLGLEQFDFSELDRFLKREEGETLTMEGVMGHLMRGELAGLAGEALEALRQELFSEISAGGRLMGQVMALGVVGAVFTNFSTVFQSSQISGTGFFLVCMLMFTFLVASLMESMAMAAEVVAEILEFMKLLMPSYFLSVAFAGGSMSAVAMYEFTLWAMAAGQWVLSGVVLPLIRVYVLLGMAGNLVKEEFLSKMTGLVEQAAGWSLKTLLGLVLGFHLIQSLVLPYVDSLKQEAVEKAVSMIPGVGQGAAAMAQLVMGSGVLIKNTMGMAAVVILMALVAAPVLKLLVFMAMYQCVAAAMEPVCDKRLVECVSIAAKGQKMLLKTVMAAALILVITVAVVCAGTNVTYYA